MVYRWETNVSVNTGVQKAYKRECSLLPAILGSCNLSREIILCCFFILLLLNISRLYSVMLATMHRVKSEIVAQTQNKINESSQKCSGINNLTKVLVFSVLFICHLLLCTVSQEQLYRFRCRWWYSLFIYLSIF